MPTAYTHTTLVMGYEKESPLLYRLARLLAGQIDRERNDPATVGECPALVDGY